MKVVLSIPDDLFDTAETPLQAARRLYDRVRGLD
jgi:hypothetical protein